MKKFIAEIFQDTDGGASMKRFAFFLFVVFFMVLTGGVIFHGIDASLVPFAQSVLDKTKEIVTWLGTLILADKAPAALSALKGDKSTNAAPKVTGG